MTTMATTATSDAPNGASGGEGNNMSSEGESFLRAAGNAAAELELGDVESQVATQSQGQGGPGDDDPPPPPAVEKPLPNNPNIAASTTSNVGIFAGDEDDTASVFSFDSIEKQPRIPLRVQNMIRKQQQAGTDNPTDSAVPFPSVVGASMEYEDVVNVCPCRCLFFTLKETICLVMSLLGCGVFMTGLVMLCMYLEGSLFTDN